MIGGLRGLLATIGYLIAQKIVEYLICWEERGVSGDIAIYGSSGGLI